MATIPVINRDNFFHKNNSGTNYGIMESCKCAICGKQTHEFFYRLDTLKRKFEPYYAVDICPDCLESMADVFRREESDYERKCSLSVKSAVDILNALSSGNVPKGEGD